MIDTQIKCDPEEDDDYSDDEGENTVEKRSYSLLELRAFSDFLSEKTKSQPGSEAKETVDESTVGLRTRNKLKAPTPTPPTPEPTATPTTLMWHESIAPEDYNMICGNSKGIKTITRWLDQWKKKANPVKLPPGVSCSLFFETHLNRPKRSEQKRRI